MEEETIDQTVTETEVEETEEGKPAVKESKTEESVKDVLGKQLGKEFASDEDALAAVDGLKKLVGDQEVAKNRKDSKKLKELEKDPQYASLRAELETVKFNQKHPDASDYVDEVKAIADAKGISYNEAFENSKFGKLVAAQKEETEDRNDKIKGIPKTDATVSKTSDEDMKEAVDKFNAGQPGAYIRARMPDVFKEQ